MNTSTHKAPGLEPRRRAADPSGRDESTPSAWPVLHTWHRPGQCSCARDHDPGTEARAHCSTKGGAPRKYFRNEVFTFRLDSLFSYMKLLPRWTTAAKSLIRGRGVLMRLSVVVAVACLSMTGLSMAGQAQAAIRKSTNIGAQGLAPALQLLAKERDVQVVYRSDLVGDRQTSGAVGELTIEEALTQLLSGTGLTFQYLEDKGITIVPIPADGRQSSSVSSHSDSGKSEGSRKTLWSRLRLAQAEEALPAAYTAPGTSEASSQSRDSQDRSVTIEEITVTAQKREERLQDVPISITVLNGEQLDSSTAQGLTEALSRVPGVGINETYQGGGTQVAVRGVTAGGALFNGSSPVSYYLDSVPFGFVRQAIGPDLNVYDLERVEVLRGPQGTLYGASSQNGVVRVLTHDAQLDEFDLKARTSVTATENGGESYRGDMAFNVPIIPGKLAARAVAGYQDLGGWIDRPNKKDANDAEISNARLKIRAQPVDEFSVDLSAWRSRGDYGGPSIANDSGRHNALNDEPITTDFDAYGATLAYHFPAVSVISMTSYLEYENTGFLDVGSLVPGRVGQTTVEAEVFAEEVQLSSTGEGVWQWTIGGMYRDADDRQYQENRINGTLAGFLSDQTYISKSTAVFGELTRIFFDGRFELTGGLRYFEDEVTAREDARNTGAPPDQLVRSKDKFDALSPRVVLTWHPRRNATIYASYAEGFRSGVSQYGNVPLINGSQFPPAEPDTLHNYEIGAKGDLADGRVSFDVALYYIDWEDVQQSLTIPITPGNVILTTALVNAESASGVGADFALTTRLPDGLELGFNFSWNDLTIDSSLSSFFGSPPVAVTLFDKGDRLNISPELTVGAFADYEFPFGGDGLLGRISASGSYTSDMDLRTIVAGAQRIAHGDAMLTGRLSLEVEAPNRWTASLFVNNVTNEQGSPVRFPFSAAITDWNAHIRPRTIGLQLELHF